MLKTFSIIYNPVSTKFKMSIIEHIICRFVSKGMTLHKVEKSRYSGHVIELIKQLDPDSDLLITVGGDGTVNEAFRAFYEIEQHSVYAHISTGTTNDMANNFGLSRKDAIKSVDLLADGGHEAMMDSFTVNGEPVSYVSAFGFVAPIPYLVNNKLKKVLGHAAYVVSAVPVLASKQNKIKLTYEHDGVEEECECIMACILNSKGTGGVNVFKDVDMNDGKFEAVFVKSLSPKLIKEIFIQYLKDDIDLRQYKEFTVAFSTDYLKIKFESTPKYEVDNDGNKASFTLKDSNNTLEYKIGKKIKILLPAHETRSESSK